MMLKADYWLCRFRYLILATICIVLFSCNASNHKTHNESSAIRNQTRDTLPFYNDATFTATWINPTDSNYKNIHTIAPFQLQNQLGNEITLDSLKGKIYTANFFFTICPSICPKMTHNLTKVQDAFKDDPEIKLLSFSVMPWADSVAVLKQYARNNDIINHKWYLLTGKKEEIYDLARKSFFAEKTEGLQKSNSTFLHTETVLLIDKHARIRGVYNATQPAAIDRIIEDIHILQLEKE
jgi:protein SCO1/2